MTTDNYTDFLSTKGFKAPKRGFSIDLADLNPLLKPFQKNIVQWGVETGCCAFFEDTGLGKQQPNTEPVLTPSGWTTIGQLKVGDFVIGSKGQATEVLGVYPQGIKRVYRLELSDGTFVRAGEEHLWSVRTKTMKARSQEFQVLSTKQINDSIHREWQLPIFEPKDSQDSLLPVDPYTLGVALGDGCFSSATANICTDTWIGEKLGWKFLRLHDTADNVGYFSAPMHISQSIYSLGLRGTVSHTKYVPGEYLLASKLQRLALLQGLMDTDGYPMENGGAEFCSTSRQMVDSVASLARSLGGIAKGIRLASSSYTYKGERRVGKPAWRINIKLPSGVPLFLLPRKANKYQEPVKYSPVRIIRRVIDEGVDEHQTCIKVAAKDSLYVTRDYILTHNTFAQGEWANQIVKKNKGERVLMLAPLAVSQQTIREGAKFGFNVSYCRDQDEVKKTSCPMIITNYERLDNFDTSQYIAVVSDESSILKSYMGKTKQTLIELFKDTPYKLCCTATPAPNDYMELGNHAEFLGVMPSNEMLTRWFINDTMNFGSYRLKGHAVQDFWDWVCTWARCVGKPSDLGDYSDEGYILPELNIHVESVKVDQTIDTKGELFRTPTNSATSLHKEKRLTVEDRAKRVSEIIEKEPNESWLVWCDTDYEADALNKAVAGLVEVRGSQKLEVKEKAALDFIDGRVKRLCSKPKIFGFGLNFQHCARMIYIGTDHSYEKFYQSSRRIYRFGQTRPVHIYVVVAETEVSIWSTMKQKEADHNTMKAEMFAASKRAVLRESEASEEYNAKADSALPDFIKGGPPTVKCINAWHGKDWTLYQADCVSFARQLPANSIGYSVFSPPFANLYIYSNSQADMGNCIDDQEFLTHYAYLAKELYRILIPGRLVSVHCKDLVNYKGRDGRAGLRDFPGEIIRVMEAAGLQYHSRVTVWKDPVIEMQRTKAHGLLYKQLRTDSTFSRQGMAEYVLTFRKWAMTEEEEKLVVPVGHECEDFPLDQWQKWASPVWMDIQQTNVLNIKLAKDDHDEKHICPLQLDLIERCIKLWSNPGDVVFDPFNGIGSTGYIAIQCNRKYLGTELKETYAKISVKNFNSDGIKQQNLFDSLGQSSIG